MRAFLDGCPHDRRPRTPASARDRLPPGDSRLPRRSPSCCVGDDGQRALLSARRAGDRARADRRARAPSAPASRCCRCTARSRPTSRTRDRGDGAAARDSGHQHRRDVADGSRRHRRRRHRAPQGRALRRGSRASTGSRSSAFRPTRPISAPAAPAALAPGRALRLWDLADRLRPHREAEIHRVDLSDAVLDVLAWGGDPRDVRMVRAPVAGAARRGARDCCEQLGAIRGGSVTADRRAHEAPAAPPAAGAHAARGGRRARRWRSPARCCQSVTRARGTATTTSDLLSAIDDERSLPPHVRMSRRDLPQLAGMPKPTGAARIGEERVPAGDPRGLSGPRGAPPRRRARREFLLASGHGAVLGRESGVRDAEFLVAIDVQAGRRGDDTPKRDRSSIASAMRSRLAARRRGSEVVHELDGSGTRPRPRA